jgi:hypothetical protein
MNKLLELLLPINCAYSYKEEDNKKCYSTTCIMNQHKDLAKDIQEKGCEIYKKDFVNSIIESKL